MSTLGSTLLNFLFVLHLRQTTFPVPLLIFNYFQPAGTSDEGDASSWPQLHKNRKSNRILKFSARLIYLLLIIQYVPFIYYLFRGSVMSWSFLYDKTDSEDHLPQVAANNNFSLFLE